MDEVAGTLMRAAVELAVIGGLDAERLCAGLPFDRRTLADVQRMPWDTYAAFVERLLEAAGGPAALEDLAARWYYRAMPPAARAAMRGVGSVRALYRAVLAVDHAVFSNFDVVCSELADGRLHIVQRLHPGARPCSAFMHFSVGAYRGMPRQLDLPEAEAEVTRLTGHELIVIVRLPDVDRRQPRAEDVQSAAHALMSMVDARARDAADAGAYGPDGQHDIDDIEDVAVAVIAWLTASGWPRSSLHVRPLDRAELVCVANGGDAAIPIAHMLPLVRFGRDIGVLGLGGLGPSLERVLDELPAIVAAIDTGRTLAAAAAVGLTASSDPTPDARPVVAGLSPRERDTLACLLDGASDKEAADRLGVSIHTVRQYVKSLYRALHVQSRTELLARFIPRDQIDGVLGGSSRPRR